MQRSTATSLARLAAALLLCTVGLWTPTTSAQSIPFCDCSSTAQCEQRYGLNYGCFFGGCHENDGFTGLCRLKTCPRRSFSGNCIDVTAYGRNPETGECCMYPNPCVIPEGWEISYTGCPE